MKTVILIFKILIFGAFKLVCLATLLYLMLSAVDFFTKNATLKLFFNFGSIGLGYLIWDIVGKEVNSKFHYYLDQLFKTK